MIDKVTQPKIILDYIVEKSGKQKEEKNGEKNFKICSNKNMTKRNITIAFIIFSLGLPLLFPCIRKILRDTRPEEIKNGFFQKTFTSGDLEATLTIKATPIKNPIEICYDGKKFYLRGKLLKKNNFKLNLLSKELKQTVTLSKLNNFLGKSYWEFSKEQNFSAENALLEYKNRLKALKTDLEGIGHTVLINEIDYGKFFPKENNNAFKDLNNNESIDPIDVPTINVDPPADDELTNVHLKIQRDGLTVKTSDDKDLQDVIGDYKLPLLSQYCGQDVMLSTFTFFVGYQYWEWAIKNENFLKHNIVEGHRGRLQALQEDLKGLNCKVSIENNINYNTVFSEEEKKKIKSRQIEHEKHLEAQRKDFFKGPFDGQFNRNFLNAFNANQRIAYTQKQWEKKAKEWGQEWGQLKKNYDAFINSLEEANTNPSKKQQNASIEKTIALINFEFKDSEEENKTIESWKKHHPDFEIKVWQDVEIENLVKELSQNHSEFSHVMEVWKKMTNNEEKSNIARLCILYKHGGIFAKKDFKCIGSMNEFIYYTNFFIGIGQTDHSVSNPDSDVGIIYAGNSLLGCRKQHPLIKRALKTLTSNNTGAGLLTNQIYVGLKTDKENNTTNTLVLPPSYFYPMPSHRLEEINKNGVKTEDFILDYSKGICH